MGYSLSFNTLYGLVTAIMFTLKDAISANKVKPLKFG